ncbi:hypothetical protein ALC62_09248, partial [Cyphomyrmex costatus]
NVTDSSLSFERLVDIEETATKAVRYDLLSFEERMSQNLKVNLEGLKKEALGDIYNTINGTLEDVNLSIHKEKKEGKNVDECYYYAKNNLESKSTNAIAELEICIQNGYTAMEGPLAVVVDSIQMTEKLLISLNAMIPICNFTSSITEQASHKEACILRSLYITRNLLKRVARNSGEATTTATGTYAKTFINVKNCIIKNTVETSIFSMNIVNYTDNCVSNVLKNDPKTIIEPTSGDP